MTVNTIKPSPSAYGACTIEIVPYLGEAPCIGTGARCPRCASHVIWRTLDKSFWLSCPGHLQATIVRARGFQLAGR